MSARASPVGSTRPPPLQPIVSQAVAPPLPHVYWTPQALADIVSVPYFLMAAYFVGCAFSIGNYVGYFRYNYNDMYSDGVKRAYIAFVVIGTATFVLFSSVVWLWAAKYSAAPSLRAQRLQWGIWAIFVLKDFPLFVIELHAIMCCGWNSSYQGFVFVVQCIFATFSFSFTWLSFIWRMAGVLQQYFGSFHEVTLKTGAEQVLIFNTPEPMNVEGAYARGYTGGSPRHFDQANITWSGNRHQSEYQPPVPHSTPMSRYSPPSSPLGRYSGAQEPGSTSRSMGGAFSPAGDEPPYHFRSSVPMSSPADQLPVRRQPVPSPWDRRPSPPSPQRSAMRAYDTHYNDPQSPLSRSRGSMTGFEGPPQGFVVDRYAI
jgi:hypothetical protein